MVSALSRKELNQKLIDQAKTYDGLAWKKALPYRQNTAIPLYDQIANLSPTNQDNFPYALREFINSHLDLPTLDEIVPQSNWATDLW